MEESNHNSQSSTLNSQLSEFDEIRPYEAEEMKQAFEDLLNDRQFNVVMKGFAPWLPKGLRNGLLRLAFTGVKTPLDFQIRFMKPVVKYIIRKYTDGCTLDEKLLVDSYNRRPTEDAPSEHGSHDHSPSAIDFKQSERYIFLSNHRDIVLDSAFLDVLLIEAGHPTTVEIGIGDNLLIYPWIKRLVRMNKAFTVKRGLSLRETLAASQLMSRYIHYAVTQKKENIWIAQREGRAKDSDDRTQESVLKMLAMGGPSVENGKTGRENSQIASLSELNIVPLTISYEYDPCDYLKAQEFQEKRDNLAFKKSRQDDLDNMRTGIFGYKGRVVYRSAAPLNTWINELAELPKTEFYKALAERIDREIHRGYELFPCNYIALDLLNGNTEQAAHYTAADQQRFEAYLDQQLAKVRVSGQKDLPFLRERMLAMYANPLRNHQAAQ